MKSRSMSTRPGDGTKRCRVEHRSELSAFNKFARRRGPRLLLKSMVIKGDRFNASPITFHVATVYVAGGTSNRKRLTSKGWRGSRERTRSDGESVTGIKRSAPGRRSRQEELKKCARARARWTSARLEDEIPPISR